MRALRILKRFLPLLALPLAAGCEDIFGSGGDRVAEDRLTFIRAAADAPPLSAQSVTLWAKPGATRRATISYVGVPHYQHDLCMEFTVPAGALVRRPDGTPVQAGDSVQITVRVVDAARFIFQFEPSGLRFAAGNPAKLRVSYWWADRDYNGDGVVDRLDTGISDRFGLWRQEREGEPWSRLQTSRFADVQEVTTDVPGFTRYAVASN
ncbi:MAG: hypothetical protein JO040_02265 [Gemmatimonadetes bacterium]|nr:hypothetical protein [Gemmatimonadota bacterium]